MTFRKAGLLTAGLVAAFAVGVMTGPTIRDNWYRMNAPEEAAAAPQQVEQTAPAPAKTDRPAARARTSSARAPEAVVPKKDAPEAVVPKKDYNTIQTIAVNLWEPKLQERVKAVLNPGSRPELAAADFDSSEQFMTVAHAARNTKVPFMVLKDRVLNRGQSLSDAIHEFKPELDARAEVTRARDAARSDLEIAG
jgi:hypothetical protein